MEVAYFGDRMKACEVNTLIKKSFEILGIDVYPDLQPGRKFCKTLTTVAV